MKSRRKENPLVQYYIHRDIDQDRMRRIGIRFFKGDEKWHFFHEGSHCLIRTDGRNRRLEDYLTLKKIKFDVGIWSDPHETVRKYQALFEPIFHAYTILGLTAEKEDFRDLFNRVVHCFCNMYSADKIMEASYSQRHSFDLIVGVVINIAQQTEERLSKLEKK